MSEEFNEETVVAKKKRFPLWIIIVAIIVIIAGSVTGIAVASSSGSLRKAAEQLELARKYVLELNYEKAIIAYQAVIDIDPKNVDAYIELADVYAEIGEDEKAIEMLNLAVEAADEDQQRKVKDKSDEIIAKLDRKNDSNDQVSLKPASMPTPSIEPTQTDEFAPDHKSSDLHDSIEPDVEYDAYGHIIKETHYGQDGSVDDIFKYEYDARGKLAKTYRYISDGRIFERYHLDGINSLKFFYWREGEKCYSVEYRFHCPSGYAGGFGLELSKIYRETSDINTIYDENNNIICIKDGEYEVFSALFDADGQCINRRIRGYFEENDIREVYIEYDHSIDMIQIWYYIHDLLFAKYSYDANDRLIKAEYDGYYHQYEYYDNGTIKKFSDRSTRNGRRSDVEYDMNEKKIKQYNYDQEGNLAGVWEYVYDENGNKIKQILRKPDGTVNMVYEYDMNEKLIKKYEYDQEGNLADVWESVYDENGNIN